MVERKTSDPSAGDPGYAARSVDARAMKAFAHPLRMMMYDFLNDHGAATATMLAKHTGESTGQTSYHLRQLERHGFVAEDPARGSGRERWWKPVGFRLDGAEMVTDPSTRPAVTALLQHQVAQRAETLADWFERSESEPAQWRESSISSRTTAAMTAQEVAELRDALMATIHEHTERAKAAHGSASSHSAGEDGIRQVRLYLDTFPLPAEEQ